ncbi:hypothetical protein ACI2JN_25050 [Ochrobactrum teleogrylli]|uniref:hypothetical protein n=1 Tax=Ochrobactrum teleogrylli TaxID=2479765 RepID=UPI00384F2618
MKIHPTAFLLAAFAVTALSGCQTLDKIERENYQRACDNLGIARDTPSYDECMLQQQRMENDDVQRSIDRSAEERLLKKL